MDDNGSDETTSPPAVVTAAAAACIFLDKHTNQCQIYEARPTQCRTYPFWPSIVESVQDWNDECRRSAADADTDSTGDSDNSNSDNSDSDNNVHPTRTLLPEWTPDAGGCEGMRPIQIDPQDDDRWVARDLAAVSSSKSSSTNLKSSSPPSPDSYFTSTNDAVRFLYQYVQDHRRFPHGADEVPVVAGAD